MSYSFRRLWRSATLLGISLSLAGAALISPAAGVANAQWAVCTDDPIVLLSNLSVIDLNATASGDLSNVKSFNYTLTVPRGVKVLLVTPGVGLPLVETFKSVTGTTNSYAATLVVKSASSVPVSLYVTHLLVRSLTVNGFSNQSVSVSFK